MSILETDWRKALAAMRKLLDEIEEQIGNGPPYSMAIDTGYDMASPGIVLKVTNLKIEQFVDVVEPNETKQQVILRQRR